MKFIFIPLIALFTSCYHNIPITSRADTFINYFNSEGEKILFKQDNYTDNFYNEFKEKLDKKYVQLFGNKEFDLSKYDNTTLQKLWEVNHIMAYQCLEKKYLDKIEDIFEIFKKRNIDKGYYTINGINHSYVDDIFGLYILFGDFLKADKLKNEYPEILKSEYVPEVYDDASIIKEHYKLYKISDDAKSIILVSRTIDKGPKIIFVSDPGCHFSKLAINAISSKEKLKNVFKKYATIIIPLSTSMSYIDEISKWNKNNPELEYFIYPHNKEFQNDWKDFYFLGGPRIYFIKDNKIIYQISGWGPTEEEFISNVSNGVGKIGINVSR